MYMGVILGTSTLGMYETGIPHVYGGDPPPSRRTRISPAVFPMYMGVILLNVFMTLTSLSIPHVYGGDPWHRHMSVPNLKYSPCIWG